jgi:hypothetical protein
MIKTLAGMLLFLSLPLLAQTGPAMVADPWSRLHFLEGTWEAKTGGGPVDSSGTYSFKPELNNHILARHSISANCKGPSSFDCEHGDLLYVYTDAEGGPLKAIYFDNEGHVIHYNVTTPTPTTAVFLSDNRSRGQLFGLRMS